MNRFTCISFLLVLFCCTGVYAGTYLPVDSRLYNDFKFLEAEGVITTGQLATLPISRLEGARLTTEAFRNAGSGSSARVQAALERLQKEFKRELDNDDIAYLKPADEANLQYVYSDGESFFAGKNRDGVEVRRGSNTFLDVTSRFDSRYVGLVVKPELNIYDDATQFTLKKAYLLANIGREEFMLGKESAWWGPGQNGSILLSTNAEPLTTFKISNSIPYFPFGIGIRGTFFVSQLENDRKDIPRPILNGIRVDIKPASFIEFGLSKSALFGGKGRKQDFTTFWHSLFGIGENWDTAAEKANEPGDQRAGYDVKVVVPWRWQPVTLYLDAAGEDQRHSFPSKWFYLAGFYLPRVLTLDRLEILGEYGTNYDPDNPGLWYTHPIYSQGYTYNGRIIGHYMGSDAKDLFLQARYNFDTAIVSLSYERLQKLFPTTSVRENFQATALCDLSQNAALTFSAGYSREADKNILMQMGLRYQFR